MSVLPEPLIDLSLVLACYNEEAVFRDSVRQILEILDHTTFTYDVIFVDDCSRDRTRQLIDEVIQQNPGKRLTRIFHAKNVGRGGTVADGIRSACGEIVGYIDLDLEVHARYIPVCVLAIKNGADVAIAWRIYRFYWRGFVRWALSNGYIKLEHLLIQLPFKDTETGFKFFRREKILPLLNQTLDTGWFWDTEIIARSYAHGYRIVEIPCLFQRRFDKKSTVNPLRDSLDYFIKLWRFRGTFSRLRKGDRSGNERTS